LSNGAPHLLHVFSTFVPAGPEMRTVALIDAFGASFRHSILAIDGRTDAREHLSGRAPVRVLESLPRAGSIATVRRLAALFRAERPDLVLSYNWGAFDAVLAARALGWKHGLHHEDGFTPDEVASFKRRRVLARRWFLPGVHRVVVPSRNLARIASEVWKLAPDRVRYVPNGVRLDRFRARDGRPELREKLGIPRDSIVVGYVGHLRPEKNPLRLLRACAIAADGRDLRVLVLGEGPERAALEALARSDPRLDARVVFAGFQRDPRDHYRAMDVFAISSDTEQMPVALLEAMATSLPVASTDVGDVKSMLCAEEAPFVVPLTGGAGGDEERARSLAGAISALASDRARRDHLGRQNRVRVERDFTFEGMLDAYRELYESALAAGSEARR